MLANIVVYDVGSTFTKAVAFHLSAGNLTFAGRAQSPTTLDGVMQGVRSAEALLAGQGVVIEPDSRRYATCSAAGGLRMVAMGYMPRVTAKAAKEVAMSAGARVMEVISHEDSPAYRLEILKEIRPDIVLLAGGTDGGEVQSAIDNARLIVESGARCLVVVACNRDAQPGVIEILNDSGIPFAISPNIMPTIHTLDIKTARAAIHREFIKQITKAKGLNELLELVTDHEIRPTPGAVLLAGELWAKGTYKQEGLGDVLMIDVGGATTDIHSVLPGVDDLREEEIGLIINNEKQVSYRTVEGNLGMRVSATGVVDAVGAEAIEQLAGLLASEADTAGPAVREALLQGNPAEFIQQYASEREQHTELLATNDLEEKIDQAMAVAACHVALKRHSGYICQEYNPKKGILPGFPVGRDLRQVDYVIGIGGIFANHEPEYGLEILRKALENDGMSLFPEDPVLLFDRHYLLFALGTLGLYEPDAVLSFMKSEQFSGQTVKRRVRTEPEHKILEHQDAHVDEAHQAWFRAQQNRKGETR